MDPLHPFTIGEISITPAAEAALRTAGLRLDDLVARHRHRDWDDPPLIVAEARFDAANGKRVVGHFRVPMSIDDDFSDRAHRAHSEAIRSESIRFETTPDRTETYVCLASERRVEEIGLVDGYDLWSQRYDSEPNVLVAVEQPVVDAWVDALPGPPGRALDAACGTGRHALSLCRRGWRVSAFDVAPGMVRTAGDRFAAATCDVELFEADLASPVALPFPEAAFDLVVCGLALSHVPDLDHAFHTLARATRPGGTLIVTDFHPDAYALGWRADCHVRGNRYLLPHAGHSRAAYLRAIDAAGLTLEAVRDIPLRDAPPGYISPGGIAAVGDRLLCLALRAGRTHR